MGKHLRKLFSVDYVKEVFQRYLSREIAVDQALAMLKIRRRQFFKLLKLYREKPGAKSKGSSIELPIPGETMRIRSLLLMFHLGNGKSLRSAQPFFLSLFLIIPSFAALACFARDIPKPRSFAVHVTEGSSNHAPKENSMRVTSLLLILYFENLNGSGRFFPLPI